MEAEDKHIRDFLDHLATERAASVYTQRNYQQSLTEFEFPGTYAISVFFALFKVGEFARLYHGILEANE